MTLNSKGIPYNGAKAWAMGFALDDNPWGGCSSAHAQWRIDWMAERVRG